MPQTNKMGFVFPSEGQEPWFDLINSFFNSVDSSLFAGREDRNLFFMDLSTITVTIPGGGGPGTADIFWSSFLTLKGFEGAGLVHVDVPGGPLTLDYNMNNVLYVDIPRPSISTAPTPTTPHVGTYLDVQGSDS